MRFRLFLLSLVQVAHVLSHSARPCYAGKVLIFNEEIWNHVFEFLILISCADPKSPNWRKRVSGVVQVHLEEYDFDDQSKGKSY